MNNKVLSFGSLGLGLLSLCLVVLLPQVLLGLSLPGLRDAAWDVGVRLAAVLPVGAIAMGLLAVHRLRAEHAGLLITGIHRAAAAGVILGGVALLLWLLGFLFVLNNPL